MHEWFHWCDAQRRQWEAAPVGYVYLGEVVLRFGRGLAGDQWCDDDLVYADADADAPQLPRLGESELSDLLEHGRFAKEQKRYAAKQRSDAVIEHVIEEARQGRLRMHTRPVRGGPLSPPAPAAFWDSKKSRHVFKRCIMSPEQPFRVAPSQDWHHVYCDEIMLGVRLRALPGAQMREVPGADLEKVIISHADVSQARLIAIVTEQFGDRPIKPAPDRIKAVDRQLRANGTLPERKLGRPRGS